MFWSQFIHNYHWSVAIVLWKEEFEIQSQDFTWLAGIFCSSASQHPWLMGEGVAWGGMVWGVASGEGVVCGGGRGLWGQSPQAPILVPASPF